MKKKKGMTREEIIDAKVYKGVLGLYGLAVFAYFIVELVRAKKAK